jgi:murein DD-endopeptidase MepM/ murein hydrolase activator NlpD
LRRLIEHAEAALERRIPEKRLYLRSGSETRYIRLTPLSQLVAGTGTALVLGWTIVVTAIFLMDAIGAGSLRDQARRDQALYEERLNAMAAERDRRAEEAAQAQERFAVALEKVSEMQSALLASEERRKEMETGITVIQTTLRRTIGERDAARRELATLVAAESGGEGSDASRAADMEDALAFLVEALEETADQRDGIAAAAEQARREVEHLALEARLAEERNELVFTRLEEAVNVSMTPLERMFREAGLPPDRILEQVRSAYARPEDRLQPIGISTRGTLDGGADPVESRANEILAGLDRINLFRIAAERAPFAQPVRTNVRFTSGFGNRRDPKTGRTRMHNGVDFAGPRGTAIHATSEGTVITAGWEGGYGNTVVIRHAFGIETLYAHLSSIDVRVGQRVSRGDRIGGMGTTGRSTGVHLHYEVRLGGTPVNPMTYIRAARNVF